MLQGFWVEPFVLGSYIQHEQILWNAQINLPNVGCSCSLIARFSFILLITSI